MRRGLSSRTFFLFAALASPAAGDEFFPPQRVGTITDSRISELSGMEPVTGLPGYFWIHNDSDNSARIFAVHESGAVIAEVTVSGAVNADWEDIALASLATAPGATHLFIADIGNNDLSRSEHTVYRIPEPSLASTAPGQRLSSPAAEAIRFAYPDGNHNAEALVVNAQTGDLFVIAKVSGTAGVYRVPDPTPGGPIQTLLRLGGVTPGDFVTAADLSADGRRLLVRTYSRVLEHRLPDGLPFERIFFVAPASLPAPAETKSESICFDHDERDYLTTSEGNPAPIHRTRPKVPQPSCAGPDLATLPVGFTRGDARAASDPETVIVDLADALAVLDAAAGAAALRCPASADADDDGDVDLDDGVALLDALVAGSPLPPPFPAHGVDLSADGLACNESAVGVPVDSGGAWRAWSSPAGPEPGWTAPQFDDGEWEDVALPIGFGLDGLATAVGGMRGSHVSLYLRRELLVESPTAPDVALLALDYNDGFVAYLNGVEAVRRGLDVPGYEVPPSLLARTHSGGRREVFPLCAELLAPGLNVLAIELHNRSVFDFTLFLDARLRWSTLADDLPVPSGPPVGARASLHLAGDPVAVGDVGEVSALCDASAPFRACGLVVGIDTTRFDVIGVATGTALAEAAWSDFAVDPLRGLVTFAAVAGIEDVDAAFAAGEALELVRIRVRALPGSAGSGRIAFTARAGQPRLATGLLTSEGAEFELELTPLDLEINDAGPPVIEHLVAARGVPGDVFYIVGRRFLTSGGLEVRVCGRRADAVPIADGQTLSVIAPACERVGPAPVEVRTEAGADVVQDGYLYEGAGNEWIRGDANGDGAVDIADASAILGELFLGRPASPRCPEALDVNADRMRDISDVIFLLRYLFQDDATVIPPPFPDADLCAG